MFILKSRLQNSRFLSLKADQRRKAPKARGSVFTLAPDLWVFLGVAETIVGSLFFFTIRSWETAHLPLPQANILP